MEVIFKSCWINLEFSIGKCFIACCRSLGCIIKSLLRNQWLNHRSSTLTGWDFIGIIFGFDEISSFLDESNDIIKSIINMHSLKLSGMVSIASLKIKR
jgi:hypothetical protein